MNNIILTWASTGSVYNNLHVPVKIKKNRVLFLSNSTHHHVVQSLLQQDKHQLHVHYLE